MGLRRDKAGMLRVDRVGDRRCLTILARNFFVENWGQAQKEKRSIKERKAGELSSDASGGCG